MYTLFKALISLIFSTPRSLFLFMRKLLNQDSRGGLFDFKVQAITK